MFLDGWLKRALRSRLEPIQKVARSIRTHQKLILNWFAAKKEFSAGIVEGLNYRVKLTIREAYGFRTLEAAEIALHHALGRAETHLRILLRRPSPAEQGLHTAGYVTQRIGACITVRRKIQ
ncbi:MAG: transposase [Phycisphaerae bacterium]|nr:transposase [Phycisphaerae bacterium]